MTSQFFFMISNHIRTIIVHEYKITLNSFCLVTDLLTVFHQQSSSFEICCKLAFTAVKSDAFFIDCSATKERAMWMNKFIPINKNEPSHMVSCF